ncbi:hypothetical protein NM688_g8640 [Phlebia brevispora]|uniref:Uncharacterized protein n=1 Tax=Phlebia brevispora TaxID=194682 RepID=A0ACC1RTN0_9APHY|nr:hypothetical protein NM688_g8640 [Phlebia brevispora]
MSGTYPIVGIQDGIGPDGERPLRYEINKFVDPKHNPYAKDQLNLFLLALEKIQAMSHTERLSWFQIAGIHGQPFINWDGSKGIDGGPDQWGGYCTHASILFPTWHRVYHALVEQAVHECMKKVLAEFPRDKQAALKPAVDHWRYPYWDWALVMPGTTDLVMPELMRLPVIEVQRPNGVMQTIDNPLYRYRFPLDAQGKVIGFTGGPPYTEAPYTVRHPAPFNKTLPVTSQETWAKGISDNDAAQTALNDVSAQRPGGRQLVVSVYQLFAMIRSFPPFSNTNWRGSGNPSQYTSLEGIHNNVHVIIGGLSRGHMAVNDFATFDAAFWMHHGNVERQLSIFQALNPADYKSWPNDPWLRSTVRPWFDGVSQVDEYGTWTRPPNTAETTNTPLTPFHKDAKGTVYDSDGCRYIANFGYAFEELQDWLPKYRDASGKFNTPLYCQDIRKALSEKYGWAMPSHHTVSHLAAAHPPSR